MNTDDDKPTNELEELRRKAEYLNRLVEQTAGRLLSADASCIAIRNELEQKRRGFRLMSELAVTLGENTDFEGVFVSVSRRLNATLNMQRTAVLFPDADGEYRPSVLQGYPPEEIDALLARRIRFEEGALDPLRPLLVTGADAVTHMGGLREALALPYLIACPVLSNERVVAVLVTGRVTEEMPFLPRLNDSDVETVQTVSAYLGAMVTGHRLRKAEDLANHDPLTRLPNLRGTIERLHHTLAIARRESFFVAVLFVDLDGFKTVNDTHGHAAGDLVLSRIAERLRRCVRESDFVGRIGGDEFLAVLSNVRQPENAAIVARNIISRLSVPIEADGAECRVGASIGIAIYPENGDDETALMQKADKAMYQVKSRGKNSFAFAD